MFDRGSWEPGRFVRCQICSTKYFPEFTKSIDFVQRNLSDIFIIFVICRTDLICRTDFVICRTDFENLSDRFVGQKTNFVGQIKFVGQMDFRILRFLHLSDRFVGQITNLSDRFKFCRTDSNGTIYVSDFCRTDLSNKTDLSDRKQNLLFVEQILFVFCVCRTESVGQIC